MSETIILGWEDMDPNNGINPEDCDHSNWDGDYGNDHCCTCGISGSDLSYITEISSLKSKLKDVRNIVQEEFQHLPLKYGLAKTIAWEKGRSHTRGWNQGYGDAVTERCTRKEEDNNRRNHETIDRQRAIRPKKALPFEE